MGQDAPKTGQRVSNLGITGINSIRIGGMTLETLPFVEQAITKQQWTQVQADNARQEVENILAEYPSQTIAYLESRVRECFDTIDRIKKMKADQQRMIDEYSVHIGLCKHRDREIAKLDPVKDVEAIKALRLAFPPYDVDAMKQQIEQCKEAILRADTVIDAEHASIVEMKQLITKCEQRDALLAPYGVKVG